MAMKLIILIALTIIHAFCPRVESFSASLPAKSYLFSRRRFPVLRSASNEKADDSQADDPNEKPAWISEAMGLSSENDTWLSKVLPLEMGLAGFSVDPKLGFVAVLVGQSDNSQRFTYAMVSPVDKNEVKSAEALTMVQLAGGLDLGTAILPPDALANLVMEDEASNEIGLTKEQLRPRVSLVQVDVRPNTKSENKIQDILTDKDAPLSSPEREAAIAESSEKVLLAVKNLAGLGDVTASDIIAAMRLHGDADTGKLDRSAFSNVLHTLRNRNKPSEPSKVVFDLVVSIIKDESISQSTISVESPMLALGLALRCKVPVNVPEDCLVDAPESDQILNRFPAFRPIRELYEDAKIMDGFIPGMFERAQIDNDQKM